MGFFLETLFGGLMSGMLYALIGLGFVLIFKASGVFNFAQGAMVLVAALSMARFSEWIPRWFGFENMILANVLAFIVSAIVMFLLAVAIERFVLRHLVNQEATTLLMATLGISYFLDGLGQIAFGSSVYSINVGMPKDPLMILDSVFEGGLLINLEDLTAAVIAALLVAALALFFQFTSTGRALRAVADDHQAAQSIGIPLNRIWVIVWSVAGLVALVAGIIWGSKFGVQFTLSTAALRALPVVILGGLTSVPRRHSRRPDHRRGRKAVRGLPGVAGGRRHRNLVRLCAGAGVPAVPSARAVRREDHRPRLTTGTLG